MNDIEQRIAIAEVYPIPLTQGFVAYVDLVDMPLVEKFKWRAKRNGRTTYAISDRGGKRVWMHRVLLETKERVDHIDNNGLNNRRSNLRLISAKDNIRRKRPNANGSSSFKGVSWYYRTRKWQASIKVNGRSFNLGHFESEEEAARAYDLAAKNYFGKFAYLNFP